MFKYPLTVTIDTNIFDAAKFDLCDTSTLRILENYVKSGKIKVFPFTVILGGDSRCNRYEVEEHPAEDDEEEIRDMDRKHSDFKRSEAMNHT